MDITKLPDSLACGNIYKMIDYGNLDNDGYEVGYLYLSEGTSVKKHTHTNDIEKYDVIVGFVNINGEDVENNVCLIGESHSIDKVYVNTIIRFCKIRKDKMDEYTFDDVIEMKNKKIKRLKDLKKVNNSK